MSKVTTKLRIPLAILILSFLSIGLVQAAPVSSHWNQQGIHQRAYQAPNQHAPNQKTRNQSKKLAVNSSQQAAQLAKRHYSAKVLSVQSTSVNGSPGYRVKLLSNKGMVFYATVNARSGSVSRN
ncbi:PepSY domain-containing protein [Shewanella sp. UCD-KL21]|uniref:PepSY domain-containing protein n=1 Tax=Shewanella sp. UCD-KL21 TaxID=1917164 RepID=UPI00158BF5BF|nr:PepSY domain-containing protein [Shewanella sp. UCD-KL21]